MIKFSGIHISSNNPKRLALFYKDVLGWNMIDDISTTDGIRFEGSDNNPVLWIWDKNRHETIFNEGPVYFVFDCPDPDALYQQLTQKGVELAPPKIASWGGKELFVTDPDGNKFLMVE